MRYPNVGLGWGLSGAASTLCSAGHSAAVANILDQVASTAADAEQQFVMACSSLWWLAAGWVSLKTVPHNANLFAHLSCARFFFFFFFFPDYVRAGHVFAVSRNVIAKHRQGRKWRLLATFNCRQRLTPSHTVVDVLLEVYFRTWLFSHNDYYRHLFWTQRKSTKKRSWYSGDLLSPNWCNYLN